MINTGNVVLLYFKVTQQLKNKHKRPKENYPIGQAKLNHHDGIKFELVPQF